VGGIAVLGAIALAGLFLIRRTRRNPPGSTEYSAPAEKHVYAGHTSPGTIYAPSPSIEVGVPHVVHELDEYRP